jgi:hypothetical protein
MELRHGEPGVTLAGVRTYLAIVASLVACIFVGSWVSSHDVRWAVAAFDVIAWLALATMGSRRIYPRLTDEDLAAIRQIQVLFLALVACGLIMSHLPAARAAGRTDREFLVYAAQVAIYVGLALNFRPPLRPLPTAIHGWIYTMGVWSIALTLFAA